MENFAQAFNALNADTTVTGRLDGAEYTGPLSKVWAWARGAGEDALDEIEVPGLGTVHTHSLRGLGYFETLEADDDYEYHHMSQAAIEGFIARVKELAVEQLQAESGLKLMVEDGEITGGFGTIPVSSDDGHAWDEATRARANAIAEKYGFFVADSDYSAPGFDNVYFEALS